MYRLSDIKCILRSVYFYLPVIFQCLMSWGEGRRVAIFPSNPKWDPASNLRAWLIVDELRSRGWVVLLVPPALSLKQRKKVLSIFKPDVLFFQQVRHPLNDPSLYGGVPTVLDMDDADFLDEKVKNKIIDAVKSASAFIGGSRFVAESMKLYNPNGHVIWTCTPNVTRVVSDPKTRSNIVVWAHSSPFAYQHEANFVREVMMSVGDRIDDCTFWMCGVDENEAAAYLKPIRDKGVVCEALPTMEYGQYLDKIAEAAVGLQPISPKNAFSQGKSFGKMLAYLSGKVVVICEDAVDHPLFVQSGKNGYLANQSLSSWVDPIVEILSNKEHRADLAGQAWVDYNERLTTPKFVDLLEPILNSVVRPSQ